MKWARWLLILTGSAAVLFMLALASFQATFLMNVQGATYYELALPMFLLVFNLAVAAIIGRNTYRIWVGHQ